MKSHEAMDRCIGRHRLAVAKALHKSAALVSKWQEPTSDFTDSGTLNPIDRLETIIKATLSEGHNRDDATAPISYLAHRFGLMGTLRYVSFRLSKALLRERVDDLIAAGVSVKVCKVDSGRTLYFEEKP